MPLLLSLLVNRRRLEEQICQRLQVGDFQIRATFRRKSGSAADKAFSTIYPNACDAEGTSRNDVVVNALGNVEYVLPRNADSLNGLEEIILRWLVTLYLLRGDHVVKIDLEMARCSREKIIIRVADDRQLKARFQTT
jgi:hypothetical protein